MPRALIVALLILAGSLPASASAHEFVVSKLGKGKMQAVTEQVFTMDAGAVECAKASAPLEFAMLKSETLDVQKLAYAECIGFGSTVKASSVSYEFNADGKVTFGSPLTFEVLGLECSITFPLKGNDLRGKVTYQNKAGKLLIKLELKGLTYTGSGGACGSGASDGEYDGTLQAEEEGGTLEW